MQRDAEEEIVPHNAMQIMFIIQHTWEGPQRFLLYGCRVLINGIQLLAHVFPLTAMARFYCHWQDEVQQSVLYTGKALHSAADLLLLH